MTSVTLEAEVTVELSDVLENVSIREILEEISFDDLMEYAYECGGVGGVVTNSWDTDSDEVLSTAVNCRPFCERFLPALLEHVSAQGDAATKWAVDMIARQLALYRLDKQLIELCTPPPAKPRAEPTFVALPDGGGGLKSFEAHMTVLRADGTSELRAATVNLYDQFGYVTLYRNGSLAASGTFSGVTAHADAYAYARAFFGEVQA